MRTECAHPLDHARREVQTGLWLRAAGVVGFALLTALGAFVAIPLPGTPVPLTLQTLFVLLAGVTLGPRLGTLSMALYLVLGITGHHVFALGGLGPAALCGPTGGYLLGFVLAQPVLGRMTSGRRLTWSRILGSLLAGQLIIFAAGLTWLSLCLNAGLWTALALGFWPFMPGLVFKTILAAVSVRAVSGGRRKACYAASARKYV
jgi:biotin transport system substrate-specific component